MLTEGLVEEAIAFLSGRIRRTPVEFSPALSALVGGPVWLKLEFLQLTGSNAICAPDRSTPPVRGTNAAPSKLRRLSRI
jgi:hypothetical protein